MSSEEQRICNVIQGEPTVNYFFSFTGIVNDGRELKYRTKKVDVKQLNLNVKLTNVNI